MEHRKRIENYSQDTPTYSRLFIVCDRKLSEDDFKDVFSKYGTIEDIRIPKNHNTGERKGIVYIKFSKTSEAAAALEAMNKSYLGDSTRPIKVMVACNRSEIQNDEHDDQKYRRLFIYVDKTATEEDIAECFQRFGFVESVFIQRNRDTGEPKGFAYVTFRKFSEAANAFENCERKYKAIFAIPKGHNRRPETNFESNVSHLAASSTNMLSSVVSMMDVPAMGYTRVQYMGAPYLSQRQVEKLFDIVPGMMACQYFFDMANNSCNGLVSYANPMSAAYAVEKLNGFEYPPGTPIFVRPDDFSNEWQGNNRAPRLPDAVKNLKRAMGNTRSGNPDLAQLAEAIAEASKLIKQATAGVTDDVVPDSKDLNYCSAELPPPQPLADIDSPVAKRCFLVCKPQPPPLTVLRDVFCRFGDLINVYTLPNKTVGYARYASVEAANKAMATLHGAEICGVRVKVLEAEEETPSKRTRYE